MSRKRFTMKIFGFSEGTEIPKIKKYKNIADIQSTNVWEPYTDGSFLLLGDEGLIYNGNREYTVIGGFLYYEDNYFMIYALDTAEQELFWYLVSPDREVAYRTKHLK